jgi:hypothetical protein
VRRTVAAQAIGDNLPRLVPQPGQQALEEAFGGRGIPPVLDEEAEHHAVLVHRAPEIVQNAIDPQVNLILSLNSAARLPETVMTGVLL